MGLLWFDSQLRLRGCVLLPLGAGAAAGEFSLSSNSYAWLAGVARSGEGMLARAAKSGDGRLVWVAARSGVSMLVCGAK